MKLSRLKFFAYTNPGLEKILKSEILGITGDGQVKNIFGKIGVEF